MGPALSSVFFALALALASLVLGCGDDGDEGEGNNSTLQPVCGNSLCEAGETSTSCAADCSGGGGGGGTNGGGGGTNGGGGGTSCGDGACNGTESADTCPDDCTPTTSCTPGCSPSGDIVNCDANGQESITECPYNGACHTNDEGLLACSCGDLTAAGTCEGDYGFGPKQVWFCDDGELNYRACSMNSTCQDDGNGGADCYCDDVFDGACDETCVGVDPDC